MHGIGEDGHTVLRSKALHGTPSNGATGIYLFEEPLPGLYPFWASPFVMNVHHEEHVGLCFVQQSRSTIEEVSARLIGSIIDGDTIIPPPLIDWTVSTPELSTAPLLLTPNPAQDRLSVEGIRSDMDALLLMDPLGRVLRTIPVRPGQRADIDLSGMPNGTYLLRAAGGEVAQRFVVAR